MKYQDYLEQRQALTNEIQTMIDEGNLGEEYTAKCAEVTALDEKWDAIAQAQADLNALADNQRMVDVQAVKGVDVQTGKVTAQVNFVDPAGMTDEDAALFRSDEYVNTWAKAMMGKRLTDNEEALIQRMNAYTHTTENTGAVVPETVASGIWDMIEEAYPLWDDVQKTYVKGNYTVPIDDTNTDAAWYDESTPTADGEDHFKQLALGGCELSRAVTISWKLREMAVADFIPFIQRKLAKKMGAGLGYGVAHGKGQPGQHDSFKPEPNGIITVLKAEEDTPQVITYDPDDGATYGDLTMQRSKVTVGTNELAYYANSTTVWSVLANIVDNNGRPIMIADPANGGINRIFGIPVKEDASLVDGEILLGAPGTGYIANVNKDVSVLTEEHVKARTVDYCAYAIVDGGVLSTKAFALLEAEPSGATGETGN